MDEQIAAKRLLCKDSVLPASAPSLKNVAKRLRHFAECVEAEPAAQVAILFGAFEKELDLYEFEMQRADMVGETCAHEMREYAEAAAGSAVDIERLGEEIAALRATLASERRARAHREEYEAQARVVNALPPRAVTEGEITVLEAELRRLEEHGGAAARRLELRKKQAALLVHSLLDLTAVLRQEGEENAAAAGGAKDEDEEMAVGGSDGEGSDEDEEGARKGGRGRGDDDDDEGAPKGGCTAELLEEAGEGSEDGPDEPPELMNDA